MDPTNTSTTATTDDTGTTSPTTTMSPTDTSASESTATDDPTTTDPTSTESTGAPAETSSESGAEVAPYGECDMDDDCGGGVCIGLYTDFMLNHHVCYPLPDCMAHDECPAPDGGTAVPICTQAGCTLDCSGGAACPGGMTCAYTDEGNRRCGWPD